MHILPNQFTFCVATASVERNVFCTLTRLRARGQQVEKNVDQEGLKNHTFVRDNLLPAFDFQGRHILFSSISACEGGDHQVVGVLLQFDLTSSTITKEKQNIFISLLNAQLVRFYKFDYNITQRWIFPHLLSFFIDRTTNNHMP